MPSPPLDYARPDTSPPHRLRMWRPLIVAVALLFALLFGAAVLKRATSWRVECEVDTVTGSLRWRTVWCWGMTSGRRSEASPLEAALKERGIAWTQSWQFLTASYYTLFGPGGIGSGAAPPIYRLRPALRVFVASSTDEELRRFVQVMQTGTATEQEAAVDRAADKALGRQTGDKSLAPNADPNAHPSPTSPAGGINFPTAPSPEIPAPGSSETPRPEDRGRTHSLSSGGEHHPPAGRAAVVLAFSRRAGRDRSPDQVQQSPAAPTARGTSSRSPAPSRPGTSSRSSPSSP